MKVELISHSGDSSELVGTLHIEDGDVRFPDLATKELCIATAFDERGPVPVKEAERFLRSLPASLTGSMIRARLIEE